MTSRPLLALALSAAAALPAPLAAQGGALEGFVPTGDYVFELGGEADATAEIYVLGQGAAYLIVSSRTASPLLLEPRAGTVQTVGLLKVAKQEDGTIDLLPGAASGTLGAFEVEMEGVTFAVDGASAVLKNKPPYLGDGGIEELFAYSIDYRRGADSYTCSEPILRELRAQPEPVEVRVFFGSWCPYCKQVMPRILKVAQQLDGSRIALAFYGLPRDIHSDAEASRFAIDGVPTGVVLVGGREVGRISGNDWKIPELAIKTALDEAS